MTTRIAPRLSSLTLIAIVALAAFAAFAFSASSADARPRPSGPWEAHTWGRPYDLEAGGTAGWYMWTDEDGVHVRSTTPSDDAHALTAIIRTDGRFVDVDKVRLEFRDVMLVSDHEIFVRFLTADGIDGVDFKVAGGEHLAFEFRAGGDLIPESRISIGVTSHRPASNPFVIERLP